MLVATFNFNNLFLTSNNSPMHPRNSTAGAESNGKPLTRMSELENSLVSIRQARDTALSRAAQLTLQLSRYEERLSELTDKLKMVEAEREVAIQRDEAARADRDRLQEKVLDLNSQKLTLIEQERVLQSKLKSTGELLETVTTERDELAAKLANVGNEHERFKAQQKRNIADLAEKYASSQKALDGALANLRTQQLVVEKQKTDIAEREKEISELKAAAAKPAAPVIAREPRMVRPRIFEAEAVSHQTMGSVDLGTPMAAVVAAVHLLSHNPDSPDLLETLETNLSSLEQRAKQSGLPALHRHVWSIVEVTRWLRKSPGKAAEFLPVLLESIDLLPELSAVPTAQQNVVDLSTAAVYAVDDDVDNCECIAMALEKLKICTLYETCPERALDELLQNPPSLVILDVDMPGLDGIAFYQKLRQSSVGATIPVLFISGLSSTESRLKNLTQGDFGYIAKPYNLASLVLSVTTMLLKTRLKAVSATQ